MFKAETKNFKRLNKLDFKKVKKYLKTIEEKKRVG